MHLCSKRLLSLLFLLLPVIIVVAQAGTTAPVGATGYAKRWFAGGTVGPDFYFGDIRQPSGAFGNNISFAGGIFGGRQLTNVFGLRAQLLAGGLRGTKNADTVAATGNYTFTGSFFEFNVNATVNFSNLFSPYKASRKFFVYGSLGIGFTSWRTQLKNLDDLSLTQPVWSSSAVIPIGVGASYSITPKINVGLEYSWRTVLSDMVDQYSAQYKFDVYDYLAVGVTYTFGKPATPPAAVLDYSYRSIPRPAPQPVQLVTPDPVRVVVPPAPEPEEFVYVVQIFAFAKHNYDPETIRRRYHIDQPVKRDFTNGINRYTVGNYKDISYARELRDTMRKKGIRDAFIIAYKDGVMHHIVPNEQ
jgi:hypothetical protein